MPGQSSPVRASQSFQFGAQGLGSRVQNSLRASGDIVQGIGGSKLGIQRGSWIGEV